MLEMQRLHRRRHEVEVAARGAGVPGRRSAHLADARQRFVRVVLGVVRVAAFDQQPIADRRRPLRRRRCGTPASSTRPPPCCSRRPRTSRGRGTCRSRRSRPRTCSSGSPDRSGGPGRCGSADRRCPARTASRSSPPADRRQSPGRVPSVTNVPAIGAFTDHARSVVKNHSLSFLIGPPCAKLKS